MFNINHMFPVPDSLGFNMIDIPEDLMERKYHGHGNGVAFFDKNNRSLIDFDYVDEKGRIINQHNEIMVDDAGSIIHENDDYIVFKANISTRKVCLF